MKVAGGAFVCCLQKSGDLHRMMMRPRTDQPTF